MKYSKKKTPVHSISCKSIKFPKIRPPYRIRHFEFVKSDPVFVVSDPKKLCLQHLVQNRLKSLAPSGIFDRHFGSTILDPPFFFYRTAPSLKNPSLGII